MKLPKPDHLDVILAELAKEERDTYADQWKAPPYVILIRHVPDDGQVAITMVSKIVGVWEVLHRRASLGAWLANDKVKRCTVLSLARPEDLPHLVLWWEREFENAGYDVFREEP